MTSPSPSIDVSALTRIKGDAIALRERLGELKPADFTTLAELATFVLAELGLNIVPMFESAVDAINEDVGTRVDDLEHAVGEIQDAEDDDQLTEETAAQILTVFQMGRALGNRVLQLAKNLDQTTQQRLKKEVKAFQTAETAIRELVEAITMLPEEDQQEAQAAAQQEGTDIRTPEEGGDEDPQDADVEAQDAAGGEG